MVVFPNAKINLGLNIISKREDGYHNISSLFYPVPFEDILEILPSRHMRFEISGLTVPGSIDNNLIIKAYELLKADFDLPPVQIHLHKKIPIGAGLGGGSSDAAFALICLNEVFTLTLSTKALEKYAAELGSDCPFFIKNQPVLAEGTGTAFSAISITLSGKYLIIISPGIHVSSAEAYRKVVPTSSQNSVKHIIESIPMNQWVRHLCNDFEVSAFNLHPKIKNIKEQMYACGAVYASMSGSGSSVYGIFDSRPEKAHFEQVSWQGFLI